MTKVKFTKFGANSAFGGFAPGDVMSCSDTMAQHLVESGVAELAPAKVAPPAVQAEPKTHPEKPARAAAKGKK